MQKYRREIKVEPECNAKEVLDKTPVTFFALF
jgi:hypothetical protein